MTLIKKVLNCNAEEDKITDTLNKSCREFYASRYRRMPTVEEEKAYALGAYKVITEIKEYIQNEI